MSNLNDLEVKVAEKALEGLDAFIDNLEEHQIIGYLNVIIPTLVQILAKKESSNIMRKASLGTIGSLVVAAESAFQPYLATVCQVVKEYNKIPPSPEYNSIRAENISLQGKLANEFCKK